MTDTPTVTLLAAGPLVDTDRLRLAAVDGGVLVGVDGGAARLLELGLVPAYATGDFDSLSPEARDALATAGCRLVPTPDQEYTDLDKALAFCRHELGARKVNVFGATGGRLDHTYNALSALAKYGRSTDVRLIDEVGEAWLVPGSSWLHGADLIGRVLSLMPLGRTDGVSVSGVYWPLRYDRLKPGERDGTSNLVTEERVEIHVETGDLIAFLHHAPMAEGTGPAI